MTYFISDGGCMHGNKYKTYLKFSNVMKVMDISMKYLLCKKNLHGILSIQPEWKEQNKLTFIVK